MRVLITPPVSGKNVQISPVGNSLMVERAALTRLVWFRSRFPSHHVNLFYKWPVTSAKASALRDIDGDLVALCRPL